MRISDWSSDVCSSDLITRYVQQWQRVATCKGRSQVDGDHCHFTPDAAGELRATAMTQDSAGRLHESTTWIDRKSVVSGKSVSVRVDLGGRRIIKKKKHKSTTHHKYINQQIKKH